MGIGAQYECIDDDTAAPMVDCNLSVYISGCEDEQVYQSCPVSCNSCIQPSNQIFQDSRVIPPPIEYSTIEGGWEGDGNLNTNPLFIDIDNNNFNLSENSPCIDAGISEIVL